MQEQKKKVCIISFSPIARDARVLRQIEYLSQHYDVTAIGQGDAHPAWPATVTWKPVPPVRLEGSFRRMLSKSTGLALLLAGKLHPAGYRRWYWRQPVMQDALAKAIESGCQAFHANDWNTLPIAAEAANVLGARLVFDDHEYAPLEFDNRRLWSIVYSSMIRHVVERYAPQADALITVAPAIARKYQEEFNLHPMVILNAPTRSADPSAKETNFDDIRLIHHGGAMPARRLEIMIEALALCHRRYSLYFMLTAADPAYPNFLKNKADELAPGRVTFLDPVPTEQVIQTVSKFDMGIYILPPINFVHAVALPNKFFDFIAAGLPTCVGPSPSMAEIVREYGLGCVTASWEPEVVAAALNQLTPEEFSRMQEGARRAAQEINAEREMGKLCELYRTLLPNAA